MLTKRLKTTHQGQSSVDVLTEKITQILLIYILLIYIQNNNQKYSNMYKCINVYNWYVILPFHYENYHHPNHHHHHHQQQCSHHHHQHHNYYHHQHRTIVIIIVIIIIIITIINTKPFSSSSSLSSSSAALFSSPPPTTTSVFYQLRFSSSRLYRPRHSTSRKAP